MKNSYKMFLKILVGISIMIPLLSGCGSKSSTTNRDYGKMNNSQQSQNATMRPYQINGKWYLAAIAYNCGDGRLKRAIQEAGSDSLRVLLDPDAKFIPLESRMYIRKILSVSLLFHNVDTLKTNDYDYLLNRAANTLLATIQVAPATTQIQHAYKVAK